MKVEKIIMTGSPNMWAIKLDNGKFLGEYFGEFGKTYAAWKTKKDATKVLEYALKNGIEKTLEKLK